jgi:hypothetical protein
VELHYDALDTCRKAARTASGDFSALHGDMPGKATKPTDSSIFGAVAGVSGLAAAIDTGWTTLLSELDDAWRKLKGVEHALNDVEENIRATHRATADAMEARTPRA